MKIKRISKTKINTNSILDNNTKLKIVSVVFAFVMWLYVMGEVNPQTTIDLKGIPVALLNVESLNQNDLVIIGEEQFFVNVKVEGRRNDLYSISNSDIIANANLVKATKGINSIPVNVNIPSNVSLKRIDAPEIRVNIDQVIKKKENIKAIAIGNAHEGYSAGKGIIEDDDVIIEGPESLVKKVKEVIAQVNIQEKSDDITTKAVIKAVDKDGELVKGIKLNKVSTMVTIPILRVKKVPILINNSNKITVKNGYKYVGENLKDKNVIIKGDEDIVQNINYIKTESVQLNNIDRKIIKNVKLLLPQGIEVDDNYVNIEFNVDKIIEYDFIYSKNDLEAVNLEENLTIYKDVVPTWIQIKILSTEEEKISQNDIKLYIDAKDKVEGIYEIDIKYESDKKIEKLEINPKKVSIQLIKNL